MVGVKGKYKGCNTCRVRRVKCDNTRPFCKKCTDHGRACEGYERETVFIVGTVDDKGRCASHPPRNLGQPQASSSSPSPSRANSRKKQAKAAAAAADAATIGSFSSSPSSSAASPQLSLRETASASPSAFLPAASRRSRGGSFAAALGGVGAGNNATSMAAAPPTMAGLEPLEPLMPAWDDGDAVALVSAASPMAPSFYRARFVALRTSQLDAVLKSLDPMTPEGQLTLRLPPSRHRDTTSAMAAASPDEVGFRLSAQCFVHIPFRALGDATIHHAGGPGPVFSSLAPAPAMSEAVCLFLYEHNASAARSNQPPWRDPTILADSILSLGPLHFRSFPAHHLFARVYRPNAIMASLLARTPCHLASPEWTTVPYELHPKTFLDSLFDIISVMPALFHRADRILPLPPATLGRRLKAKDLLSNCLNIEARLARWYAGIERAAAGNHDMPLLYWIHGSLNLDSGPATGRQRHAQIPFADTYDFASTVFGLGHVYYWTSLMLLYECLAALIDAVLYDGTGASSDPFTDPAGAGLSSSSLVGANVLAPAATIVPSTLGSTSNDLLPPGCEAARYQVRERRKLAANICRSLDWMIGSPSVSSAFPRREQEEVEGRQPQLDDSTTIEGHPDLALAPLHVVERFYGALWSPDGRDGELERTWCRDFRRRLECRGREVEAWVGGRGGGGGRGWLEVGRFG
ncbi:Aspercryptin biosynthesis cluster-specific transcription regulator atnN [Apiospora rasikravindrae]|uniref:Aspercryptin biosynthesis cluster-specific transcription regulator atnN n=1 Tax=Apiospora rasikravindrae TaxID=990691 RepID=A0ABR1SMX8_9PEZI